MTSIEMSIFVTHSCNVRFRYSGFGKAFGNVFFFLLSLALTELKFFLNNVDFLQQSWLLCSCHLVQRRKSRMIAFGEVVLDYHDSGFELCG